MAAAMALANLTRKPVPDSVREACAGRKFEYGSEYIIPTPFDPRLKTELPIAIAKAAMESGIATVAIEDWKAYEQELLERGIMFEKKAKNEAALREQSNDQIQDLRKVFKSFQRPTVKVVFVKHGESIWDKSGKFTGWSDVPLTDEGKQ